MEDDRNYHFYKARTKNDMVEVDEIEIPVGSTILEQFTDDPDMGQSYIITKKNINGTIFSTEKFNYTFSEMRISQKTHLPVYLGLDDLAWNEMTRLIPTFHKTDEKNNKYF